MDDVLTELPRRSIWHGWGDPAANKPLPGAAWLMFQKVSGVKPAKSETPPVTLEAVQLPESRLSPAMLEALREVLEPDQLSTEHLDRVEHAGGKGYPDLYRLRTGDGSHAPDAVVFPNDSAQISQLLTVCVEHSIAVVPFGGGTSVVSGVDPEPGEHAAVISLDLRRLDQVISIDPISQIAVLQAGIRGPQVEAALSEYGLTVGHFPQSHQQATIGGYLVTRSSGQSSSGYGRFEQNVIAAKVVTPSGELELGGRTAARASAAGPNLIDFVIGSEGILGIVTEVSVQCHLSPKVIEHQSWIFPELSSGIAALRDLAQQLGHGLMPDVCRLSDAEETRTTLLPSRAGLTALAGAKLRGWSDPVLTVMRWEDQDQAASKYRRSRAERIMRSHGAKPAASRIAESWMRHRFSGPYQRDQLMNRGILAETLETATTWANLEQLYQAVREALSKELGPNRILQCHVSHLYRGGASLYFMFACALPEDPIGKWQQLKQVGGDAISAAGGTITHHHGVGKDHLPWIATELGTGISMLRAVKQELDPANILNPTKLLPPQKRP